MNETTWYAKYMEVAQLNEQLLEQRKHHNAMWKELEKANLLLQEAYGMVCEANKLFEMKLKNLDERSK